jgi:hypothetical protein
MADGFLGRWSQRKQAVREGKALDEPASFQIDAVVPTDEPNERHAEAPEKLPEKPPLPTLQDVTNLSSESDFKPFVARDVAPEVRNAAMKKLFADPRYNVMDGLDIYIDDYAKPDPLPTAMLRQMASAKFLNLFDEDPDAEKSPLNPAPDLSGAVLPLTEPPAPTQAIDHDNTDLRLQQDDAPGPQQPGRGTQ